MITPNIEALSLGELRYIARKQGVEDAEMMDREDLLEALQELYEENESGITGEGVYYSPSTQRRFMNTLVEHEDHNGNNALPGVEQLPESYSETRIHLLLKNPYWAHAYWSVCTQDLLKLDQTCESFEFFLRVTMHESADQRLPEDSYDIEIGKSDTSWNINLPERGRVYSVSLHYQDLQDGTGLLCQSDTIATPKSYWLDHAQNLAQDDEKFSLLFSPLVTKGGVMVDNPLLNEVVEHMDARVGG
ncbi:DUF4912 domain-containing protein [Pleomorphochaeta sp. DL1XJH-081]|jgi:hypothetical protein|uniref:DUF4912 domain-containing protein n=1 Tax=Pleomorphochaeta sp. DL1XJH-081 TaxID=3409690 RepID=UPI003BB6E8F9